LRTLRVFLLRMPPNISILLLLAIGVEWELPVFQGRVLTLRLLTSGSI